MLTARQAFVLANLSRVTREHPRRATIGNVERLRLDGRNCTKQVRSLILKGLVERTASGQLVRRHKDEGSLAIEQASAEHKTFSTRALRQGSRSGDVAPNERC